MPSQVHANKFEQAVEIVLVIKEMAGDADPADVRGIAHGNQNFVLLQKIHQADIFIHVAKREGYNAGSAAPVFWRDDANALLPQAGDEMVGEGEHVFTNVRDT